MAKKKKKKGGSKKGRTVDMGAVKNKQEELDTRSTGDIPYWDVKEGWNYFRLAPPWSDENIFYREVLRHKTIVCPKRTNGDPKCFICSRLPVLRKAGKTQAVKDWTPRPRAYFNAWRTDKTGKKFKPDDIRVLGASPTVFKEILEEVLESGSICGLEDGSVLKIHRKGQGLKTRYRVRFGDEVDISGLISDNWEDFLIDLDGLSSSPPQNELKEYYSGSDRGGSSADEDEDEDNDEDEIEEDDIDEDLENEDEDELFEDKPKKKKKKKKGKSEAPPKKKDKGKPPKRRKK